jgi:hypothetical protein
MRNLIISAMFSLFLLFPMTIYAAAGDMILDGTSQTSTTDFNVSKGVTITYAVPAGNVGFTAISNHLQGDTLYGAGSDTTQLFKTQTGKTKGTIYETLPVSSNSTAAFIDTGWDKM